MELLLEYYWGKNSYGQSRKGKEVIARSTKVQKSTAINTSWHSSTSLLHRPVMMILGRLASLFRRKKLQMVVNKFFIFFLFSLTATEILGCVDKYLRCFFFRNVRFLELAVKLLFFCNYNSWATFGAISILKIQQAWLNNFTCGSCQKWFCMLH